MIEERQIDAFIGATVESGLSLNGLAIFQNGETTFEQYWC